MPDILADASATNPDWEAIESGICILPVGSTEQHSAHLPLATDTLIATHYARFVGRELGAAVLPALAIATSYEHTGFRGSFSLRPETMMAYIRDIADEAERQAFDTLIVLNAHGGNFSLAPVVRDINRMDRKIKIILCTADAGVAAGGSATDIHAGDEETSVMLHLHPDLVGETRVDTKPGRWTEQEFSRGDLNLYGIRAVSGSGTLGRPSAASTEKGRDLVAAEETRLLAKIKERLAWLAENRTYGSRDNRDESA